MKKFPWGKVIEVHRIGTFEITEYEVDKAFLSDGEKDAVEFSIDGHSFDTLDQALLGSICKKYDNVDSLPYAMRLLNMDK